MAIYSDVTRESVLKAVREYDEKGKDRFLDEHGYGPAYRYFLVVDGVEYDSKAILGVACGYQHPNADPLPRDAFPGGKNTVAKKLQSLGFKVRVESKKAQPTRSAPRVERRPALGEPIPNLKWSEWCAHSEVIDKDDPVLDRIGIYRFRFVDRTGNAIGQSRFLAADSSGVVYIGRSKVPLKNRLRRIPHSRNTGKSAHTLGLKLHVLDSLPAFQSWSENLILECQYAHCSDPAETEKELMRAYVAKYGEIPALNGEFPNRGDRAAWAEYLD